MVNRIVGVDIGTTSLRAVEIEGPDKAKPLFAGYAIVPLPPGAVDRGEVVEPNTVAQCLRQLWTKGKFKSRTAVLGMGNQRVLVRDLTVPYATRERIRETLPFQVQDMLPLPVSDALLDFYPVAESQSDTGPVLTGLLVAAVKDAVLGNVRATEKAGLRATDVDVIPFALARVLATRAQLGGTYALVDIGAATTNVVIVKDGVPQFVRIIPAGGADLTTALQSTLQVDAETAERQKREFGLLRRVESQEERAVSDVLVQTVGELLTSLRNTVNYYVNTRPEDRVEGIVLTGGGSLLAGLPEALAEMSRIPVHAGDPFRVVGLTRKVSAEALRIDRPSLSVALGLALRRAA
ncbi:type IV pilus assembly protein PilM [Leifsonia sp. 1010]|uniref:type IV pilus assembly protein PilM n=1 Tax=Leifsonia sp. 1010 TaxID=2817769 RepID=UPI00285B07B5|nr:type IV pilus assembly protein PilM [Leifsonia sp. 1010]MDR6610627.1 type IV pilus assembly protein PilM [Leifsonia sp. 1010]